MKEKPLDGLWQTISSSGGDDSTVVRTICHVVDAITKLHVLLNLSRFYYYFMHSTTTLDLIITCL